ncbi:hypothetical protein T310_4779 [Rasamsonia emersonii CBS 393.64]|uniref:Uncharacterized protein n=1 Tax=Rasamsonia emersonii (strain ATCC 16479 / CBS 393.64 / IMI 116815) TaxID=1408163 RepID=A0A0F4YTP4_RASE3|nr:hypothetical protein T310_4779 [Rasamsonia emersonii CBS 393.64]KKA21201.1 hypothetical protein T310_4779 [Rasamsonia emersonii CBS 393.64]
MSTDNHVVKNHVYTNQTAAQTINQSAIVVNLYRKTNSSGRDIAANAVLPRICLRISVDNLCRIRRDIRAIRRRSLADLHPLDLLSSSLRLDRGDVIARPSVVPRVSKVELAPSARVSTVAVRGQTAAGSRTPATLRVLGKGNVLGLAGIQGEAQSGMTVPAVHLAVRAVLVPEDHDPRIGVAALELRHVFVLRGLAFRDFDDVAAPGVADVALVGDTAAAAAGAGRGAEACGREGAAGGYRGPVAAGRGGGGGGRGSARVSVSLKRKPLRRDASRGLPCYGSEHGAVHDRADGPACRRHTARQGGNITPVKSKPTSSHEALNCLRSNRYALANAIHGAVNNDLPWTSSTSLDLEWLENSHSHFPRRGSDRISIGYGCIDADRHGMAAPKPNATWNPFLVNEKDNTGEIILANWIFFTFGENKSFNRDLYLYLIIKLKLLASRTMPPAGTYSTLG